MAVTPKTTFVSPIQIEDSSSNPAAVIVGTGAPTGSADPQKSAKIGSLYIRASQTDDYSPWYLKIDENDADEDWVQVWIDKDQEGKTMTSALTMDTDNSIYLRDAGQRLYSPADGTGAWALTGSDVVEIGDQSGANYVRFATDGEISLHGTARVTRKVDLPLDSQHGSATNAAFLGAPSIVLDADGEIWINSFVAPPDWNAASDMTVVFMVANEIAETDNDTVSFTGQARGYADGDTMSDAGQAVTVLQALTGGDQAINVANRCTGVLDYDHGTYPIAAGDTVICEWTVNLAGGIETTGPMHIIAQWVEYTSDKLGVAT